jgi:hypothetical protein
MSFLRRLLGGDRPGGEDDAPPTESNAAPATGSDAGPELDPDDEEREHERAVLREEARRLDELQQRQLRYADRAWTPPRQGGERRADDEDAATGG